MGIKINKKVKEYDYNWEDEYKKVIEEYNKTMNRDVMYKKFPEYVAADRLKPIEMDPKNYKTVYTIRIRLIKVHRLVVADKLTNRYGGKGVISAILPDSEMPVVDGKKVELIMNP